MKTMTQIPSVSFTGEEIMSGAFAPRQAEMAMRHGPIYKWTITEGYDAGDYVFMVGPEANRFVFHTHRERFSHDLGWTPLVGDTLGKGLLNMDDPEHARHRKMWNPAFAASAMEAYLPVMQRVIAARSSTWPARGEVNMLDEMREITFDAAAGALAGFEVGPQVDRLRGMFYTLLHGFEAGGDLSFDEIMERMIDAQTNLFGILLGLIAERRNMPPDKLPHDVLSAIVRARDDQGQALTDEQVLAHLNILLVAGHETTTTLGAWTLHMLASRPDLRERARAELDALPGDHEGPLPPEALRGMKFIDNFVKETGRLFPPVINVPRGVLQDFEFGGYEVPAGAQVRLALAACHLLPSVFAEPEKFDPDRFAPPREEDKRTPYSLVTFGGGPRICIGINFANVEVKALVAHVLRHYDLEPVADQPLIHAGHWNAIVPGGVRVRVRPRAA